jgi:hypothetical protein
VSRRIQQTIDKTLLLINLNNTKTMKKFFAIAAMAAMLIACGDNKEDNKPNNGGDPVEPEFVSLITIDGDMSDWATLDATKVVEATCAEGDVKHGELKKVKIYADELYINVYFEAAEPEADVPYHIDLALTSTTMS